MSDATPDGMPGEARPAEVEPAELPPLPPAVEPVNGTGPRHAAPEVVGAGHPRRWFLTGSALVVLGAGAGVGAALTRSEPEPTPTVVPEVLVQAIAAERALLADLDATTGGSADVRRLLMQIRADHAAHLRALTGLAERYDSRPDVPAPRAAARTAAYLRSAERRAAATAAARALTLQGSSAGLATLLASIAASEASHAELLS